MIYKISQKSLSEIKKIDFNKEKNIQELIESSLQEIFGFSLIKSELTIGEFRLDSLAYNRDSNSFVILEYKNTRNESIVDQGYSYLNRAIERKAELVLAYQKATKETKTTEDFDWSETRIIFISTHLNNYQKSAINQSMPIDLYEISMFEGGIILLNEIKPKNEYGNKEKEIITKRIPQINVYTLDDILQDVNEDLIDLYKDIRDYAISLDSAIIEKPNKAYIAFKINQKKNFFSISFSKNQIEIVLNIRKTQMENTYGLAEDISHKGYSVAHWALKVNPSTDFDQIEFYIKQAYKKVKED